MHLIFKSKENIETKMNFMNHINFLKLRFFIVAKNTKLKIHKSISNLIREVILFLNEIHVIFFNKNF